jgi:hypothetical protein
VHRNGQFTKNALGGKFKEAKKIATAKVSGKLSEVASLLSVKGN